MMKNGLWDYSLYKKNSDLYFIDNINIADPSLSQTRKKKKKLGSFSTKYMLMGGVFVKQLQ